MSEAAADPRVSDLRVLRESLEKTIENALVAFVELSGVRVVSLTLEFAPYTITIGQPRKATPLEGRTVSVGLEI